MNDAASAQRWTCDACGVYGVWTNEHQWYGSLEDLKSWYTIVGKAVRVTRVGGHVAIYHVRQPPRLAGTRLVQRIVITRAWHTPRVCFVFEKPPPASETQLFEAV